jgi:hypothetical protein
MGYKVFLSYSSTIDTPYSLPTYEETRRRFLNLGTCIKANMLCAFSSSYVFINKRKESKTPNTYDLMLEAKLVNLKKIPKSTSIRNSKKGLTLTDYRTHSDWRIQSIKQQPMTSRLVQRIHTNNKAQTIHYCLTNEPSNKKRNLAKNSDCNLSIVTHDDSPTK